MDDNIWCVKDKSHIWCAIEGNSDPGEGSTQVRTECGDRITFPYGIEKRQPTCEVCGKEL